MKAFFRNFFASLLALIVGSGCMSVILFTTIVSALTVGLLKSSDSSEPMDLKEHTILKLDMSALRESAAEENPFALLLNGFDDNGPAYLFEVTEAIRKAKDNPNIDAIYLNIEGIDASLAALEEVRRALIDFKGSGKPIFAYADQYGQKDYYISSVADHLLLNPMGNVGLVGLSADITMFKEALDKLGVKMEVFKVGTYKSAVEPYILNEISPENRRQVEEYLTGLWDKIVTDIAEASEKRGVSKEEILSFVNSGAALDLAQEAQKAGLVDSIMFRQDVEDFVRAELTLEEGKRLYMISASEMARQPEARSDHSEDEILVITAEGEIIDAPVSPYSGDGPVINASLIDDINKAAKDEDVKAVVLRVNSPGGSAFLSEQIHHAIERLRERKPVVVSMGGYAASGGYYISAPANYIVAEASTLTGSIGIFGLLPNGAALASKIGVHNSNVKTGPYAELANPSLVRGLSPESKAIMQRNVENGYKIFLTRVANGRGMSLEAVDSVGQGRVWLGSKAKTLGLVDEIGGLRTAISKAAELASLSEYKARYYKRNDTIFDSLFGTRDGALPEFVARVRRSFMSEPERALMDQMEILGKPYEVKARLPYGFQTY